jgi:CDP-diacylglycerol--serine O-phosphatidyltransferase
MIRFINDPANAITMIGLLFAMIASASALSGRLDIAVALSLWSLLADHLDGYVATRTRNRSRDMGEIGKHLDSFADLVSAGIFPGILALSLTKSHPIGVCAAALLVAATALRLAFFNVFGLSEARFIGVPTTYALPIVSALFLAKPLLDARIFTNVYLLSITVLAVFFVSSLRVPKTKGMMYLVVSTYCIGASGVLALRGWSLL